MSQASEPGRGCVVVAVPWLLSSVAHELWHVKRESEVCRWVR
jgi:hypothetical protein